MRAYNLALIVFIFSMSLAFISGLGIVDGGIETLYIGSLTPEEFVYDNQNEFSGIATDTPTVDNQATFSWYNAVYKSVVLGIPFVVKVFLYATFGLPVLLDVIGIPGTLAALLGVLGWLIYLMGIVQWVTNRGFKQND